MNHKQLKAKRKRAHAHSHPRHDAKAAALFAATEKAKRSRKSKAVQQQIVFDLMADAGYVPNGKGGWRRWQQVKQAVSTIDKDN